MKKLILVIVSMFFINISFSQQISGKVVDENQKPLVGASVTIENSYLGCTTNQDGYFTLKSKIKETKVIISYIGFKTKILDVKINDKNIELGNIQLETSAFISDEIIIKAIRASSITPTPHTTIQNQELKEKKTLQDIPFLLDLTPSFVANSESGTGVGYTNYRIRGTDPTRINVSVNGIALNDAESQSVFWVNMPNFASSVQDLQINRGIGTSTNGSASFGGSINFSTKSSKDTPYAEIGLMGGSFKTHSQNIIAGTGLINNNLAIDINLFNIGSDGYVENSFVNNQSATINATWKNKNNLLKANIIYGKQKVGISWWGCPQDSLITNRRYNPAGEYFDENGIRKYYKNQTDNYIQTHYQLLYSKKINENININTAIHYTRGDGFYEQYKEDAKLAKYIIKNQNITIPYTLIAGNDTTNINIEHKIKKSDLIERKMMANDFYGATFSINYDKRKLKFSLGGAYNQYIGHHFGNIIWMQYALNINKDYEWYRNIGFKNDFNIYAKINYELTNNLYLYSDLQYRNVFYKLEGKDYELLTNGQQITLDQSHIFNFINPKIGLFYAINENMDIYVSSAISNREPTRTNFKDAAGDPTKTPKNERLFDYEIGYSAKYQKSITSINLYYMDYINQLVPTGEKSAVGYNILTNVPKSYRAGVELSTKIKILKQLELMANLNLSRNKIKNFVNWATCYDENWNEEEKSFNLGETDIAYSPNIIASAAINYSPFTNFNISWINKYVGSQYFDNTSNENRKINAYYVNNLHFDYNIKTNKIENINIKLMINNLFNYKYSDNAYGGIWYEQGVEKTWAYYFPQAGINFMGGITVNF